MNISPETYTELNNSYFKEVKEVYIDLRIIQDVYLGALVLKCCNTNDASGYQHILNNIPKYNKRVHDDYLTLFPELNMTTEQVERMVKDPENTQRLLEMSPMTSMFIELRDWATTIRNHNVRNKYYNPVIWNINVHPFRLTKEQIQFLKKRILLIDPNAILGVINKPIEEMSKYNLRKFQYVLVYDTVNFLSKNKKMSRYLYYEHLFTSAKIYGPSRLEDLSLLDAPEAELKKSFEIAAALVGHCCDFEYIDIHILTD